MDYFWLNKGFVENPSRNYFLSSYHIILMLFSVTLGILLWMIIRNKQVKTQKLILKLVGILILILEVLRIIIFYIIDDVSLIGAFQFHLCSVGVYFSIIAMLFQRRWMYDLYFIHAFLGAPLAIIIPLGILPFYNDYSFLPIQSFISHMLLIWTLVAVYKLKLWKVELKNYYISVIGLVISYALAIFFSNYNSLSSNGGHDNFLWVNYPDPYFPIISNWQAPYHSILMFLLLILAGFLTSYTLTKKRLKEHQLQITHD